MRLENKNSKRTRLSLWAIVLLSIVFIISSSILIQKVNSSQSYIQYKMNCIGNATALEKNAGAAIKQLNKGAKINSSLLQESLSLAEEFEELHVVLTIFKNVKTNNSKQLNFIQLTILQQELIAAEELCHEIISTNRSELQQKSSALSNYWTYTYITLIVACLFMLILAATALYVGKTKKKLLEEKSKNKFIFEKSINIIISSDLNGKIQEFNPVAQKLFGYTLEETLNICSKDLYQSESTAEEVSKALKRDGVFSGEVVNRRKDGTFFISFLSANTIYDQDGNFLGTMGISRDITKEKEAKQEFQNIVNNAQDIIYTANTQGKFTFANYTGSSVMGYSGGELVGKSFTHLVHPEEVDRVRKFYTTQYRKK